MLLSRAVEPQETRAPRQRCPRRMIPLDVFGSESVAADLLQQVRWRDGVTCPRCRSDLTVRNGSYRAIQRYIRKDCDRTFNDKTGTIFARSKVALHRWLFSIYAFLRFNTNLRQPQCEIGGLTRRSIGASSASRERSMRLPSLSLVRSKSTRFTSLPGRWVASAIGSRARVACRHVTVAHTTAISRRLHSRRSWHRPAVRHPGESHGRIDDSTPAGRSPEGVFYRLYRRLSGVRPAGGRRRIRPRIRRPRRW